MKTIAPRTPGGWLALVAIAWTVAVEGLRLHGQVHIRFALPSHLAILVIAILIGRGKQLRTASVFFPIAAALVALEVAATAFVTPPPYLFVGTMRITALLAGFAMVSVLTLVATAQPEQAPVSPMPVSRPALGLAVFVISFAVLVITRGLSDHALAIGQDEVIDVLQSRWMWQPGFGPAYDPETLQQLRLGFTFVHDGRLYGQYAPGWPLVIALASAVGLFSYVSVILGALSVVLCFLIAEALLDWRSGLACALLLLTQPWFIVWHEGFMPHPLTITLSLLSAWLLIRARGLTTRRNLVLLLAGLSAGWAAAARPLTGACLLASLALWCWLSEATRPGRRILDTLFLGAGAVAPVVFTLIYNARSTGNPFVFGYSYLHGSLHSLGFGIRGFIAGTPEPFTPVHALQALVSRLNDFLQYGIGFALLLPALAMALASGRRPKWKRLVPFLTLPIAYFFYFFSVNRFYLELLPFAILGWVVLVMGTGMLSRQASLALIFLACLGNALVTGQRPLATRNVNRAVRLLARRAARERLLVLVDTVGAPRGSQILTFFGLAGVERDARPFVLFSSRDDSLFIRRFRDRTPLWVTWVGPEVPAIREQHTH